MSENQNGSIVEVRGLRTYFPIKSRSLIPRVVGQVMAVDGIDFTIGAGETLGLVGESGSGKTTAARSVLMLVKPTAGSVKLDGTEITTLNARQLRPIRRKTSMIFQDPYNALNPRHTVGSIISAPFEIQKVKPQGGVKRAVQDLMQRVGLNPEHYNRYPNEFSGGQRQRIGIARAVALHPELVVCDEPVSALDVSIQAQILNLLHDLQKEFNIAYLFVAHDLAVVRQVSHRIAVMYLGHIVESAPRKNIYTMPLHPYTRSLLSAVPVPDPVRQRQRTRIVLQGDVPSPIDPPSGCVFHTRCWLYEKLGQPERCTTEDPPLRPFGEDHVVACHFAEELQGQAVGESSVEVDAAAAAAAAIGVVNAEPGESVPDVNANSQESSSTQA
jgi:oligopeptide/dipeptide ABC transporter ATP-binding protein